MELYEHPDPPLEVFPSATSDLDRLSLILMLLSYSGSTDIQAVLDLDRCLDAHNPEEAVAEAFRRHKKAISGAVATTKQDTDYL